MKKHRMEFSIVIVFCVFITLFLWDNLYAVNKLLPIVLLCVSGILLLTNIFSFSAKKGGEPHETYFPKYFAQSAVTTIIGIAIVMVAAVLLNKNNFAKTFDFTTNKINSLSPESTKFLSSLNKDVQIICIPSPNPTDRYCEQSNDLVSLYAKNSSHIVNLGALNLGNRALMQKVQPSGFSRLVLITDSNKSEIDGNLTESKITNGIINLIKFKKTVYFLTGFGEPSLNASETNRSYSDVVSSLQGKSYDVKEWSLKQGNLPQEAKVLVAGDNEVAYPSSVQNLIQSFVDRGGKVLLIVNPYREQGLSEFYAHINLKLDNILLTLNPNTALGQQVAKTTLNRPPVMITNFNNTSPITQAVAQIYGSQALMPVDGARPISILPISETVKVKPVITTLMTAYSAAPITLTPEQRNKINLDAPFTLLPDPNYNPDANWNLGVDVELNKSEVVVYGFSLVNQYSKSIPISEELIPLTVAHLYKDEELVSIPPRDMAPKQFNLSRNPGGWILFFSGILPLLTAIVGFALWVRRRSA